AHAPTTPPIQRSRRGERPPDDARRWRVRFKDGSSGLLIRKLPHSKNWKMSYWVGGREFRETTGTADPDEAKKILKAKLDEIAGVRRGDRPFVPPSSRQLTVDETLTALETHFAAANKKGLKQARAHMAAVRVAFGSAKAIAITPELVDHWITRWRAQAVADATINRRTQLLGQALRYARIGAVPKFTHLKENNARTGTVAR